VIFKSVLACFKLFQLQVDKDAERPQINNDHGNCSALQKSITQAHRTHHVSLGCVYILESLSSVILVELVLETGLHQISSCLLMAME
jgi:hypothetical protein